MKRNKLTLGGRLNQSPHGHVGAGKQKKRVYKRGVRTSMFGSLTENPLVTSLYSLGVVRTKRKTRGVKRSVPIVKPNEGNYGGFIGGRKG